MKNASLILSLAVLLAASLDGCENQSEPPVYGYSQGGGAVDPRAYQGMYTPVGNMSAYGGQTGMTAGANGPVYGMPQTTSPLPGMAPSSTLSPVDPIAAAQGYAPQQYVPGSALPAAPETEAAPPAAQQDATQPENAVDGQPTPDGMVEGDNGVAPSVLIPGGYYPAYDYSSAPAPVYLPQPIYITSPWIIAPECYPCSAFWYQPAIIFIDDSHHDHHHDHDHDHDGDGHGGHSGGLTGGGTSHATPIVSATGRPAGANGAGATAIPRPVIAKNPARHDGSDVSKDLRTPSMPPTAGQNAVGNGSPKAKPATPATPAAKPVAAERPVVITRPLPAAPAAPVVHFDPDLAVRSAQAPIVRSAPPAPMPEYRAAPRIQVEAAPPPPQVQIRSAGPVGQQYGQAGLMMQGRGR